METLETTVNSCVRKVVLISQYPRSIPEDGAQFDEAKPKILEGLAGTEATSDADNKFHIVEVSVGSDDKDKNFIQMFEEQMGGWDAALAVITADTRPLFTAGNLWLEIGLWIGRYGDSRIACVYDSTDTFKLTPPPLTLTHCSFIGVESQAEIISIAKDLLVRNGAAGDLFL